MLTHGLSSLRGRDCEPFRRHMLEAALAESDVWMLDSVMIEINGRPGGDFIPMLGELATGQDR